MRQPQWKLFMSNAVLRIFQKKKKEKKTVYETISSLIFRMDSAVLETDSAPCLVHCVCGDECLGTGVWGRKGSN